VRERQPPHRSWIELSATLDFMLATLVGNGAAWSVATLPAIKGQLAPLPAACEGPLLALFGHGAMSELSPLSAQKRTSDNIATQVSSILVGHMPKSAKYVCIVEFA
jgi:hypothetical protein